MRPARRSLDNMCKSGAACVTLPSGWEPDAGLGHIACPQLRCSAILECSCCRMQAVLEPGDVILFPRCPATMTL